MSRLFPDSKTFVDKKLRFPAGKIIKEFENLVLNNGGQPLELEQIRKFVEDNFEDEGLELESWVPEDWTPNPEFIAKLKKPKLRGLARRINLLWKDLSRKIKDDVKNNPNLYSIIYVPNGFVVPGGEKIIFNNRSCLVFTTLFAIFCLPNDRWRCHQKVYTRQDADKT